MYRSITHRNGKAVLISERADRNFMYGNLLFATKVPDGIVITEYRWFYFEQTANFELTVTDISMTDYDLNEVKTHMDNETCPLCEEHVKQLVKVNDHRIEHDELCEACYEKEDALAMAHEELERSSEWGRVY